MKPTLGSSDFKNKKDPDKFNDNTTDWVAWAASSSSSTSETGKDA
ncbi:MAG: hypothetical protein ABI763_06070 [Bacteroidota bacterium]